MVNETKILDYITVGGYETDATGNLVIKTTMTNECSALVQKMDERNFLSRPVDIKEGTGTTPGFLFSVHEFFTDLLLTNLAGHPETLDIASVQAASRTYNDQKNVRAVYKWTGDMAGAVPETARIVRDHIQFSSAQVLPDGSYRLRMYRGGPVALHKMITSVLDIPEKYIRSHTDHRDYVISPEEFDIRMLEEIRLVQEQEERPVYMFTYDQLCDARLVDAPDKSTDIELDVPENCMLFLDGAPASAGHISIVKKFDYTSCPNFSLIAFGNTAGTMGLLDRYDDEYIWLDFMFNAEDGQIEEDPVAVNIEQFYAMRPRMATDADVNVFNAKLRSLGLKYNPDERSIKPLIESLKPGDVYYRPEFDAVSGRFVSKECVFNGSADEFTIIIERKTGFKTRERCDALVEFYNNSLSTAFARDSGAGELLEHNIE